MDLFPILTLAAVLLAIPAAIIFAVVLIVRRGLQMKNLAHQGVPVTGKILLVTRLGSVNHSKQTRHWRLRYSFTLPDGRTFENGITPSEEERLMQVGGPIALVYLPTDPRVSGTRRMVNLSRQALKLPPL